MDGQAGPGSGAAEDRTAAAKVASAHSDSQVLHCQLRNLRGVFDPGLRDLDDLPGDYLGYGVGAILKVQGA